MTEILRVGSRHAAAMLGIFLLSAAVMGCASSTPDSKWASDGNAEEPADSNVPVVPHGDADPDVEQTGEAGKLREPKTVAVPVPKKGEDYEGLVRGRSTVVVNAPIAKVRKHVIDFGKYADFMPHYNAARVLRRKKDGTREVYMQWAALHGAIKMHARFDMVPSERDGSEKWTSSFINGNVRDAYATWTIKALSETKTELTLEAFLLPKLPLPTSLLNNENTSGAEKGVVAMRKHIEEN